MIKQSQRPMLIAISSDQLIAHCC